MRILLISLLLTPLISLGACMDFYNQNLKTLQGEKFNLCEHQDKPILFVNTASKCGFTSQFEGLENLYRENKENIMVVGFPSNDFNQELTTDKEIQDFCKMTYAVEFPMMSKSSVIGPKANPVYKNLASITGEAPLWNFYKFLVMPNVESVHVFGSMTRPDSKKITSLLKPYIK
jgi:glutathione peroxidase